ncbi:MAG: dienelactone hydrolase, partial [Planctomycetota bacterium]
MIAFALLLSLIPQDEPAAYDPTTAPTTAAESKPIDLEVRDADRGRTIPIRVRLPPRADGDAVEPAPVLLFSHGLGGSRESGAYLAERWSARGYVCVNLQHPGSDEAVWKEVRPFRRLAALKQAASAKNYLLRVQDVPVVLDQLEAWNRDEAHPLSGRLDLTRIGMSGHSFGA